jgi:hypothetical protein
LEVIAPEAAFPFNPLALARGAFLFRASLFVTFRVVSSVR